MKVKAVNPIVRTWGQSQMKAVSPLTQKNGSFRSHQVYNMADRSKSCSCASILVIFGFHDASLEWWLTQPRRKEYSYQCISEKKRKNSDISVSIVPTCYRHITDCRSSVGRLVVCVCGKTCQPTVGHLLANSQPTDSRQLTDSQLTGFLGSSSSQLPTNWYCYVI